MVLTGKDPVLSLTWIMQPYPEKVVLLLLAQGVPHTCPDVATARGCVSENSPYNGKKNPNLQNIRSTFPARSRFVKSSPCLFFLAASLFCLGQEHCPPIVQESRSSKYTRPTLFHLLFFLGVGVKNREQSSFRAASGITSTRCGNESSSSGSLPASKLKASVRKAGFIYQPTACYVTNRFPSQNCHVCHSAWNFTMSFNNRLVKCHSWSLDS